MLTGLLVMPLYVPVLIFGIAASTPSAGGDMGLMRPGWACWRCLALPPVLAPLAIAAALRAGLR